MNEENKIKIDNKYLECINNTLCDQYFALHI